MIIPGVGIGPLRIGQQLSEIEAFEDETSPRADRTRFMLIRVGNIHAILNDDVVVQVIAETAEAGSTSRGVQVGLTHEALLNVVERLEYDEEQGLWFAPDDLGVAYELERPNRLIRTPDDPTAEPEMYQMIDPEHAVVSRIYVVAFDELVAWELE